MGGAGDVLVAVAVDAAADVTDDAAVDADVAAVDTVATAAGMDVAT